MAGSLKIGIVSCSGEDCLGGTISRLATRKMLDEIRPDSTITICLPLFIAGGEQEREFANNYPTITVDGCDKCCAKRATEKYSGKVDVEVLVSNIIGNEKARNGALSTRNLTQEHLDMVKKVSKDIRIKFDDLLNDYLQGKLDKEIKFDQNNSGGCGCGCNK